jgi:hypothetical protein
MKKGLLKAKNEEKGAYKGQNEGIDPQQFFYFSKKSKSS